MLTLHVVTEKCDGGWQVRVVSGQFLKGTTLIQNGHLFDLARNSVFSSRRAARAALRIYKSLPERRHIKIIGGLH